MSSTLPPKSNLGSTLSTSGQVYHSIGEPGDEVHPFTKSSQTSLVLKTVKSTQFSPREERTKALKNKKDRQYKNVHPIKGILKNREGKSDLGYPVGKACGKSAPHRAKHDFLFLSLVFLPLFLP